MFNLPAGLNAVARAKQIAAERAAAEAERLKITR